MPSEVDISNLALSHLGDAATVSSISPPEGSAQASHCARFYPIARDALLEMQSWGFNTVRTLLAQVTNNFTMWTYAYQAPSEMLATIAVLPSDAIDDYSTPYRTGYTPFGVINTGQAIYTPQPYAVEYDPDLGVQVILTNQETAVLRHTILVSDTSLFSPTFVTTLSYLLASYLAGPVIKGDAGMKVADVMLKKAMGWLEMARTSDAGDSMIRPAQSTPWMTSR